MVRAAGLEDAQAISRIYVATWRTAYRGLLPSDFLAALTESTYEDRWRRSLAEGHSRVYVAEERGSIVGFASGGRERAGEVGFGGELYAIYIADAAQRRGHGRRLVGAVAGALREMGFSDMIVWVLRDNPAARSFYERLGGVYVRTQPISIGSAVLQEVSYGWRTLDVLLSEVAEAEPG